jgi:hypothetical protein
MRASLLTRAGSAAAIGALAITGAMATTGAADAATAHRLPTHLAIAKRHAVEHHKRITVIGGVLRSHTVALKDKTVFIDRRAPGGKWAVIGHEQTNRFGQVAFVVNPKATAQFVLVYKGSVNFLPSHSRVVTVKVK